jgi:hypothetical protein
MLRALTSAVTANGTTTKHRTKKTKIELSNQQIYTQQGVNKLLLIYGKI